MWYGTCEKTRNFETTIPLWYYYDLDAVAESTNSVPQNGNDRCSYYGLTTYQNLRFSWNVPSVLPLDKQYIPIKKTHTYGNEMNPRNLQVFFLPIPAWQLNNTPPGIGELLSSILISVFVPLDWIHPCHKIVICNYIIEMPICKKMSGEDGTYKWFWII